MNKFLVLVFSLSAYYTPLNGRPDPQKSMLYPTDPPPLLPSKAKGLFCANPRNFTFQQNKQPPRPVDAPSPPDHVSRPRSTVNVKGRNCYFGFCEDADEYPDNYILSILNQTSDFDSLFNTIVPAIDGRLPDEEENICGATMNITYPKVGKNIDNKIRIIANLNLYKQGIVMETCRENSVCEFSDSFPFGVKTFCKQRYTQLRLLALDDDNKPTLDVFPAPSCCVCMYKRT